MEELTSLIKKTFPRNGWALIRTTKKKPFNYTGYMFTAYDRKDDISPILDIKGRNLKSISDQLKKR